MMPPKKAVLLAAGLGTRMRPLTLKLPKPLVQVYGRTLVDRALDCLKRAGVDEVVINVHYLADQMEEHLKTRHDIKIIISDERDGLLDSAGGVVKALSYIGEDLRDEPFYILNSDTFWIDGDKQSLLQLSEAFDPEKMDMLLLTVRRDQLPSPEKGDFLMADNGQLVRAPKDHPDAVTYASAIITTPDIFAQSRKEPHSLNVYFDEAIAKGRLYGLPFEGSWYTVGTMDMIENVEKLMQERGQS